MFRKTASGILLFFLLMGTLVLVFDFQPVKANTLDDIIIEADGSITPPTAPITTVDNITYTLTDNVYEPMLIRRNGIVVDGAGYILQGSGMIEGISLVGDANVTVSNVTIKNMTIKSWGDGIQLEFSSNNSISGNNITANGSTGIILRYSSNNTISGNNITANNGIASGVWLRFSSNNNIISENNITNNYNGIWLEDSSNQRIFHNNFVNNSFQVFHSNSANIWDDGYPSGGNYWSDYNGTDLYSGPYQNISGSDGIGDTPYVIDPNNIDLYPLVRAPQVVYNPSDVNRDGIVNMKDVMTVVHAFNSFPQQPRWDPGCDLNHDNRIDLRDIVIVVLNFGKSN